MNIDPNPFVPPRASVADRDVSGCPSTAGRVVACVDGLLALTMAAAFGMMALRANYGDPADLFMIGVVLVFFAPKILLCGLASLGMWRRWRLRWLLQALAILWLFDLAPWFGL
jgi:hypothetical protein